MSAEDLPAASPDAPAPRRMSLEEVLDRATTFHQNGELDAAETLYGHILEQVPDCADALHFLGVLLHQTKRSVPAVRLIREAIRLDPGQAAMHNNLGNVHAQQNCPDEAIQAYGAALALDPAHAEAHNNLGAGLRALGRLPEAEASYRRAIALNPAFRDAQDNLGRLLMSLGRLDEAILCHAKALELAPKSLDSRRFIVVAYVAAGHIERAVEIAEQWVRDEPQSATARHLLAATSGLDVPARASDAFVETAFDRFAASFDTKLAGLDYRAPDLVAAALATACGAPQGALVILDAGCGTGLCGPLLLPFASTLSGVDLSSKMMEKAAQRGCYGTLAKAELTRHMQEHPQAFDAIVSADTFCYFGALDAVLGAAAGALRPAGTLIFSVEAEESDAPVRLNPHGRYSHRRSHVEAALAGAALLPVSIQQAVLRTENCRPVHGLVVIARKGA